MKRRINPGDEMTLSGGIVTLVMDKDNKTIYLAEFDRPLYGPYGGEVIYNEDEEVYYEHDLSEKSVEEALQDGEKIIPECKEDEETLWEIREQLIRGER